MYVYEVIDHQKGNIVGIYTSMEAAREKIFELTDNVAFEYKYGRYRIWPNYVKDVIYEAQSYFMFSQDERERQFDEYDPSDINAMPF